ncbi:MAG: fumarylacetoacetate hydrolase family protein [Gammaproteobacteria bacterium]|nr:fumarylacetoacetate hydrolase family protein [Gammaproteobacteria bacterium]
MRGGLLGLVFLLSACAKVAPPPTQQVFIDHVISAQAQGAAVPKVSQLLPAVTVADAQTLQKTLVAQRVQAGERVVGYKAGLTNVALQQKFGIDTPLIGALFARGAYPQDRNIKLKPYYKPLIETEIGFIISVAIAEAVSAETDLSQKIVMALPVIELPDMAFADPNNLTAMDLIASNVGAAGYIFGEPVTLKNRDVNKVSAKLTLNNEIMSQGHASDALGDQWVALRWLINAAVAQGWSLQPGDILITGALGTVVPAQKGVYVADFGDLGRIGFTVEETP